ncbi:MAG: hypothetical protein ACI9DC_001700 [Gammaproteobacteria bacterium]|jgi:hypothetical protein
MCCCWPASSGPDRAWRSQRLGRFRQLAQTVSQRRAQSLLVQPRNGAGVGGLGRADNPQLIARTNVELRSLAVQHLILEDERIDHRRFTQSFEAPCGTAVAGLHVRMQQQ